MRKILLAAVLMISLGGIANGQEFKDKFFSSFGFSPFLDFGVAPAEAYPIDNYDSNTGLHYTTYGAQQNTYAGFTFAYEGRYNLYESGENLAISVKARPTAGITFAEYGFGAFYLPLGIGLEIGNGSTYQTSSNMGFSITTGYSLNFIPLLTSDDFSSHIEHPKTSWGSPFVALGVRFWNKRNKLREINLLYGFGGGSGDVPSNYVTENGDKVSGSYMINLSWLIFKNY